MSQKATMFSPCTPSRSAPARLCVPIMPMFNFSFGEIFPNARYGPVSQAAAPAAAERLRNERRLSDDFMNFTTGLLDSADGSGVGGCGSVKDAAWLRRRVR